MSIADSAEYWIEELIKSMNKLRSRATATEPSDLNRNAGYLAALDDIADEMGITVQKVYTRR